MSKRGYVYHDHPRPFCGEGCPAYGESPLIQRYRKGSAMSEPRTEADDEEISEAVQDVHRAIEAEAAAPRPTMTDKNTPLRDALDALAEAFPVDEISDAPWVVERGSIAWMILEGEHGPQVGNFIFEADARWVAAARNAIEAEAAANVTESVTSAPQGLDVKRLDMALVAAGVRLGVATLHRVRDEYTRLAPSAPTGGPRHVHGQGEICDTECPHWVWRAAQEDDLQAICPKCGYDYGRHLVPGNLCPDEKD